MDYIRVSSNSKLVCEHNLNLTLPVDHASCAEDKDGSFPRPTSGDQ